MQEVEDGVNELLSNVTGERHWSTVRGGERKDPVKHCHLMRTLSITKKLKLETLFDGERCELEHFRADVYFMFS